MYRWLIYCPPCAVQNGWLRYPACNLAPDSCWCARDALVHVNRRASLCLQCSIEVLTYVILPPSAPVLNLLFTPFQVLDLGVTRKLVHRLFEMFPYKCSGGAPLARSGAATQRAANSRFKHLGRHCRACRMPPGYVALPVLIQVSGSTALSYPCLLPPGILACTPRPIAESFCSQSVILLECYISPHLASLSGMS